MSRETLNNSFYRVKVRLRLRPGNKIGRRTRVARNTNDDKSFFLREKVSFLLGFLYLFLLSAKF